MSNSPSNVFLVLNEVLEGIEVEQVQESKTMQKMRVLAKERAEIQGEIHEKLKLGFGLTLQLSSPSPLLL